MTGIAQYPRQLTGQGMERRVEDQTAGVVATDVALPLAGGHEDTKEQDCDNQYLLSKQHVFCLF
jgi:hypothetical protein